MSEIMRNQLLDKIEAVDYWQEHFANKTFMKALVGVLKLHKPDNSNFCIECTHDFIIIDYPCPTIQAIEKELS